MQVAIAKIGNDNYLVTPDTHLAPYKYVESTYTDFANTLNQLGVSSAYQDVSKLNFNILESPDDPYFSQD